MKILQTLPLLAILALPLHAQEAAKSILSWFDGIKVSQQTLFDTSISFGASAGGGSANPGDLVNEVDREYDNGFVRTLDGGNIGGSLTGYWDYEDASQVVGNTLNFSAFTAGTGFAHEQEIDDIPGLELSGHHIFRSQEGRNIGFETGIGFLSKHQNQSGNIDLFRTQDSYDVTALVNAGLMPGPNRSALDVSQGGVDANTTTLVIDDIPATRTGPTQVGGAAIRDFDATLWTLRLGAYIEQVLNQKLSVAFHGGALLTIVDGEFSYNETIDGTNITGAVEDTEALWGGYIGVSANYHLSDGLALFAGYQYQSHEDYILGDNARQATLDLSEAYLLQLGISFRF